MSTPNPSAPAQAGPLPADVRVGLATKLGAAGTALLTAAALLAPLLEGAGAGTSRTLATLATILLAVTVLGRMLQAAAIALGAGAPSTVIVNSPPAGELLVGESIAGAVGYAERGIAPGELGAEGGQG